MAESNRPPVAIRIVRPYASEDELLEHELETIGKTAVVLIGAHPRPAGVILRFEVALASGATLLRGEGRVLSHKENAFRGQPGLTLRFTRLDPKSKAVVDRATALREARTQGDISSVAPPAPNARASGAPAPAASSVDPAIANALSESTPAPGGALPNTRRGVSGSSPSTAHTRQEAAVETARANAREKANAQARANAKRTGGPSNVAVRGASSPQPPTVGAPVAPRAHEDDGPTHVETRASSPPNEASAYESVPPTVEYAPLTPEPPTKHGESVASPPLAVSARSREPSGAREPVDPPQDRAELLERLRSRAASLPRERVDEILAARPDR